MTYSRIKAIFMPLASARYIDELQQRIEQLENALRQAVTESDRLRCAVMTHRETALIQARQIKQLNETVEKRDARIEELNIEVEEATVDQSQYQHLVDLINCFEDEKEKYEKRIRTLRSSLRDAREALRRSAAPEIDEVPEPVDMTSAPPPQTSDLISTEDSRPSADWLQQLPENI